jgi:hypothetical protein
MLNIGEITQNHLFLTLFYDHPSDGSRGLLSLEDQNMVTLSNRVRFDSPTYILSPRVGGSPVTYPIEPYLLNLMPNAYDTATAPLIPFLFPGGRLNVQITRPDGTVDDLGGIPILQNQLSTDALDERTRFGEASPLNAYRLTTLNPLLTEYLFEQYGEYQINLTGQLEDVWGNTYTGGGTYQMTIAELLDLTPGALPGTPFTIGDTLNPAVHIAPGVPAEITATVRVFPLSGGDAIEYTLNGTANRYGYAILEGDPVVFDTPGEYVIDYEARYTDAQGRLWAASLRSAGVIDDAIGEIIAHGRRGAADVDTDLNPAWFNRSIYADVVGVDSDDIRPYAPYHSGDIAWMADTVNNQGQGLVPAMTAQDRIGVYENWLTAALTSPQLAARAVEDSLPLVMLSQGSYGPPLAPDQISNVHRCASWCDRAAVRPGGRGWWSAAAA